MTSLLRQKTPKSAQLSFDATSAAAWAAACKATAAVTEMLDLLALSYRHKALYKTLHEQVEINTRLTPCALGSKTRTTPARSWNFSDFSDLVTVAKALRDVTLDGAVEEVAETTLFGPLLIARERAAVEIVALFGEAEKYGKLVKRERAYERLSGEASLRRLIR